MNATDAARTFALLTVILSKNHDLKPPNVYLNIGTVVELDFHGLTVKDANRWAEILNLPPVRPQRITTADHQAYVNYQTGNEQFRVTAYRAIPGVNLVRMAAADVQ